MRPQRDFTNGTRFRARDWTLGFLLFSAWMFLRWYVLDDHVGSLADKVKAAAVGGVTILVWWASSIPLARRVERENRESLRALFWLPWIGLSIGVCIAYFAWFMPQLSTRIGSGLGGSFAFFLTLPVVFASSWRNPAKGPNKSPEATPDERPPVLPSPPSGAPQL